MANYKKISDKIEEIKIDNPRTANTDLKWINIINAGKTEIDYLRKNYNFDLSHLRASSAAVSAQRPLIFNGSGYLFLILHFPILKDGRIIAGEIDFFIGHGFLISIHNNNLGALAELLSFGKKSPEQLLSYSLESSAILLYEILGRLINDCYKLVDNNSLDINVVEDLIFSGQQKEAVKSILTLRRNIINIRRIIQNHKNILKQLMDMKSSLVERSAIKKLYERLVDDSKRLWEMLDNQKEMIEVFNSTNESLLNDQMTNIMKTLTIFSVIVFPLTLLAAIFGMNAKYMPFVEGPYGFWIIISIMAVGSLGMLAFFKRKMWI